MSQKVSIVVVALAVGVLASCSVDQQTINETVEDALAEKKAEAGVYDETHPPPEDIVIAGALPNVTISEDTSGGYTLRTPRRIVDRGEDLHVYNALTTPCEVFPDNGESGKNVGVGKWVTFEADSTVADGVVIGFEIRCGGWEDQIAFEIEG